MQDLNTITLTGNLTRDPEGKTYGSGDGFLCKMRVATNDRVKGSNGEWGDKVNYFDVTVFGKQGENCERYLAKGKRVLVQGRLSWSEWKAEDGSGRQKVEIIAQQVQFLSPPDGDGERGGGRSRSRDDDERPRASDRGSFQPQADDDDIPF